MKIDVDKVKKYSNKDVEIVLNNDKFIKGHVFNIWESQGEPTKFGITYHSNPRIGDAIRWVAFVDIKKIRVLENQGVL